MNKLTSFVALAFVCIAGNAFAVEANTTEQTTEQTQAQPVQIKDQQEQATEQKLSGCGCKKKKKNNPQAIFSA